MVTGANCNGEVKIWSCESWRCLQTLQILAPHPTTELSSTPLIPRLKATIDLSAQYLILSDIRREVGIKPFPPPHVFFCSRINDIILVFRILRPFRFSTFTAELI